MTQYVGLDVGDEHSSLCILDAAGEILEESRMRTTPDALRARFTRMPRSRVVLETGTHSAWMSRLMTTMGHEGIVANARKLALITANLSKDDRTDAETLARLGRADPALLAPIQHRRAETQADLAVLRAREALVRTRTVLVNHVRGAVKAVGGGRLPACSTASLGLRPKRADSGQRTSQLGITKAGDGMLRRLLVSSAQYILGPFGRDSDLRRWGETLAARGGKNAKKRAVVAVARKLAVLLHRLWATGMVYDPLYATHRRAAGDAGDARLMMHD